MTKQEVLDQIKGGLIVSCQALENEPLYDSYIMSKMAYAAQWGGAKGIRANGVSDILKIRERVNLPMIGIIKSNYVDSEVYITPSMDEVDKLVDCGVEIIAMDGTNRVRPGGIRLEELFEQVKKKYPNQLFMADCSTLEDGVRAERLGFDLVGTTLCGYTAETSETIIPNFKLISDLKCKLYIPVIAEGGIWSPQELAKVMECEAFAAVVGTAITRPGEITKKYVEVLK